MKHLHWMATGLAALLAAGCMSTTGVGPIPCTYRFKGLNRQAEQQKVDHAIRSVASGAVVKSGTPTYPEYKFSVARLADLDRIHPLLVYRPARMRFASDLEPTLNLRNPIVDLTFDSTDVTASMEVMLTFNVSPGSRLFYKDADGAETEITSRVDAKGRASLPTTIRRNQEFIYARAVKDNVTRYIRINIFTREVSDVSKREY